MRLLRPDQPGNSGPQTRIDRSADPEPSAQFDAALAQRLALTRRPQPRLTWRDNFAHAWRQTFHSPRPLLRPVFALVALTAVASIALLPQRPATPGMEPPVVTRSVDRSFVADCVAQRRQDAAAEPLADLAAQNLAGHLDNAAPSAPMPTADTGPF